MLDYSTLMSDEYFHPICIFFALHDKQTAVVYSRIHLMLNMIMTGGMLVGLYKYCFTHFKTKEAAYKYYCK